MNDNASLSDYVQRWVDNNAARGTPRMRRHVVMALLVVAGAGLLIAFFSAAFATVLGRFW